MPDTQRRFAARFFSSTADVRNSKCNPKRRDMTAQRYPERPALARRLSRRLQRRECRARRLGTAHTRAKSGAATSRRPKGHLTMGPTGGGSRTRCVPSEVPAVNSARERDSEYSGKRIYVRYELDYARTVGPL